MTTEAENILDAIINLYLDYINEFGLFSGIMQAHEDGLVSRSEVVACAKALEASGIECVDHGA